MEAALRHHPMREAFLLGDCFRQEDSPAIGPAMRSAQTLGRHSPITDREVLKWLVLSTLATCLALALGALVVEKIVSRTPTRIALAEVPVEKVAEFGHRDGAFAIALPDAPSDTGPVEPRRIVPERPAESPRTIAEVAPETGSVLPIAFSLVQGETAVGGGVGVRKTIALPQGDMTGLTIFIVGDAVIEVERSELARALAAIGAGSETTVLPDAGGNGRLSLDRLRHAGLDLRYDAVRDRLVLHP